MTIEQLFNPISARISEHESTLYTTEVEGIANFYSEIRTIEQNIGQFPIEKAIPVLEFNIKRLATLIKNLYDKIPEEVLKMDRKELIRSVFHFKGEPKEKSKKKPDIAVPYIHDLIHLDELEYFKNWMMGMLEPRLAQQETHDASPTRNNSDIPKVVFELSPQFPLKALADNYEPLLTPQQASLFLHYLISSQTIPSYGPQTFGRLVKVLFARNDKNGRDDFSIINELKKNEMDLQKVITTLQNLISFIERDVQKVKKPTRKEF